MSTAKIHRRVALFFLLIFSAAILTCNQQSPQNLVLNTFPAKGDLVRLTIFYPSTGSINALLNLHERGIFSLDSMEVIGVFHEKERTDYQRAMKLVRDKNISWIRFYRIRGAISSRTLYQRNECTPVFERIFRESDGIIFFGGADIPPYLYGQETSLLTGIRTPYRHFAELSCLFHLLGGSQNPEFQPLLSQNPNFPILGICLGSQSINVATGGTMIQDIWNYLYGKSTVEEVLSLDKTQWHTNPWAKLHPEENLIPYNLHPIQISETGKFVTTFGFSASDHPFVTSAHHQMYQAPGKGIRFIATSMDGKVPEALEHEQFTNVLGIQFHPEFPILWDKERTFRFTPADTQAISLYQLLENNPPSVDFNRKIWAWFREKLFENHNRATEPR